MVNVERRLGFWFDGVVRAVKRDWTALMRDLRGTILIVIMVKLERELLLRDRSGS